MRASCCCTMAAAGARSAAAFRLRHQRWPLHNADFVRTTISVCVFMKEPPPRPGCSISTIMTISLALKPLMVFFIVMVLLSCRQAGRKCE